MRALEILGPEWKEVTRDRVEWSRLVAACVRKELPAIFGSSVYLAKVGIHVYTTAAVPIVELPIRFHEHISGKHMALLAGTRLDTRMEVQIQSGSLVVVGAVNGVLRKEIRKDWILGVRFCRFSIYLLSLRWAMAPLDDADDILSYTPMGKSGFGKLLNAWSESDSGPWEWFAPLDWEQLRPVKIRVILDTMTTDGKCVGLVCIQISDDMGVTKLISGAFVVFGEEETLHADLELLTIGIRLLVKTLCCTGRVAASVGSLLLDVCEQPVC